MRGRELINLGMSGTAARMDTAFRPPKSLCPVDQSSAFLICAVCSLVIDIYPTVTSMAPERPVASGDGAEEADLAKVS